MTSLRGTFHQHRLTVERFDRHRGLDRSSRTPATPPGVRVRTERFGKLRLRGQPGDTQLVEVAIGKCHMNDSTRVHPPAATVHGHNHRCVLGHSPSTQLTVDGRLLSPVFQVESPQATTNPSVKVVEDAWGVREVEVFLPATQI